MKRQDREKFYILDGHSLAYRAFFAIPFTLTTKEGRHTNAVMGFTNMLLRLIQDETPAYLAVTFDYPAPTFRHHIYGDYKATRQKAPPEMSEQFPLIKEILTAFRIPFFELEGYEADDLIGTLVREARETGFDPVIVTADADTFQLLDPGVEILITRRGISQIERYNQEKLQADYGLTAEQWIDFKALKGDSSDNIPGIPGVGEKTALQLLQEYGSLEEIIRRSAEIKGRVGESIACNVDRVLLGKELVIINRHVPLSFSPEQWRFCGPDRQALMTVLRRLELNNIIKNLEQSRLFGEPVPAQPYVVPAPSPQGKTNDGDKRLPPPREAGFHPAIAQNLTGLTALMEKLKQDDTFTLLLDTAAISASGRSNPEWLLLAAAGSGVARLPLGEGMMPPEILWNSLKSVLQNPDKKLVTHDYKPLYKLLAGRGIEPACTVFDTMLAAYLLEPARASYDLPTLCRETQEFSSLLPEDARDEQLLAGCCAGSLPLMAKLLSLLRKQGMERLYFSVELPLVAVLARMEMRGIKVEEKVLSRLAGELQEELASLDREIMALAGESFNINSPKQLSKILFEKIGLPVIRRIKTGYSTDARALQELAAHHPIAAKLVQYRTVSKLINTYIDGLRPSINTETGRIHTTFNQTVTATGRLSSSDPNLQNIPTRFAEGRRLREAFTVSGKDNIFLSADYSQIELRIMAHLSGDEGLLDAFQRDQDVHTRTAAVVFNVSLEEVTPQQRNAAKAVNFGIIYGISDYGLSQDLKISRTEAKKFIDEYFRRYGGVADYIKRCVETARREGYVTTLMARQRYIPDINHPNHSRRGFAERVARNTPIQGSAADIIKAAMVAIDRELAHQGFAAVMLLQVHDELIFELPFHELAAVARCVQRLMEGAFPLNVPLKVDLKAGPDWYHLCALEGDVRA